MRHYTERFKKAVVKKVLSPGVILAEVGEKLNVHRSTIRQWKKQYQEELQAEIQQEETKLLETIHPADEEPLDIDKLILEYERKHLSAKQQVQEQTIDRIVDQGKLPSEYGNREKYLLVERYRHVPADQRGILLRRAGLRSDHISLWEEELLSMSKKKIDNNEYIRKIEDENKALQKKVRELERDKKELKILVELKKKYPSLFKEDGDD
jgi:transposase-like protein